MHDPRALERHRALVPGAVGVQFATASTFLKLVILTSFLSSFPAPVQPSQVENYKTALGNWTHWLD